MGVANSTGGEVPQSGVSGSVPPSKRYAPPPPTRAAILTVSTVRRDGWRSAIQHHRSGNLTSSTRLKSWDSHARTATRWVGSSRFAVMMTAGCANQPLSLSDREAIGFGSTFTDCNRWLGKSGLPYLFRKELPFVLAGLGPPTPIDTGRDGLSLSVPVVSTSAYGAVSHL